MPSLLTRLGHRSATSQRIFVRSDTGGTLSAVVNGVTHTGETVSTADALTVRSFNASATDGVGVIDVTGIGAGSYSASIRLDGTEYDTLTIPPCPLAGDTFSIAWGSCITASVGFQSAKYIADVIRPAAFFAQGDWPYTTSSAAKWGETPGGTSGALPYDIENYYTLHRQLLRHPHLNHLGRRVPFYYQADDHEWPGNDWDHTVTQANSGTPMGASDQDDVDDAFLAGLYAVRAYAKGNPDNPDSGIDANALYTRFTIGDAEFFILDGISYRDALTTTDAYPAKTMLGDTQTAWLLDSLENSTATWKVIVSNKKTYRCTPDNGDTWGFNYTAHRDYILAQIAARSVTGVIWIAGDRHIPDVMGTDSHACVNACPISVEYTVDGQGTTYPTGIRWKLLGATGVLPAWRYGHYGVLTFHGSEYVEAKIMNTANRRDWGGRINAGSNAWAEPVVAYG